MTQPGAILSLFPGVGLLDRAFESEGFCVVRGPDLLWGGDVRRLRLIRGACWGMIGGPPCQDFSGLRRTEPSGYGQAMLREFARCVRQGEPEWWLMENVARVPNVKIGGYTWQRFESDQGWFMRVSRLRHWQFGSRSGILLDPPRGRLLPGCEPAALANDGRTFREVCRLQGLSDDFDLPAFTVEAKVAAVGNGVPLVMGRAVARAVRRAYGMPLGGTLKSIEQAAAEADNACDRRRCKCGCGRVIRCRHGLYFGPACRKRPSGRVTHRGEIFDPPAEESVMVHVTLQDGSRMLFEATEAVFFYPESAFMPGGTSMDIGKCDMARMLSAGDVLSIRGERSAA